MTTIDTLDTRDTNDTVAVADLLARMGAAWAAHDATAFADLYADDATVVTAGTYIQGKEQIRAFMVAGFDGPLRGTESTEQPQRIRFLAPDVAVVDSLGGYRPAGEAVVPPHLQRRATWVLARTGGDWLVESYHNCAANPA